MSRVTVVTWTMYFYVKYRITMFRCNSQNGVRASVEGEKNNAKHYYRNH